MLTHESFDYGTKFAASGSTICAAAGSLGVLISNDYGTTWHVFNTSSGLAWPYAGDVAVSSSIVCVGTSRGLSVTTDNGVRWFTYL